MTIGQLINLFDKSDRTVRDFNRLFKHLNIKGDGHVEILEPIAYKEGYRVIQMDNKSIEVNLSKYSDIDELNDFDICPGYRLLKGSSRIKGQETRLKFKVKDLNGNYSEFKRMVDVCWYYGIAKNSHIYEVIKTNGYIKINNLLIVRLEKGESYV